MVFIWFGAAVSLAEIVAGTYFAPLGFERGMQAIIVGHLIGAVLFFLAGYIGARTRKSAMETVKISFGKYGSFVFSLSNVAQLIGWTSIMIVAGATAAQYLVPQFGFPVWTLIIGALIIVWIALGLKRMERIQAIAAILLAVLVFVISFTVFNSVAFNPIAFNSITEQSVALNEYISFGAAVELAVAMPLSWLPVVSDYTRQAQKPLSASLGATLSYTLGSIWMFAVGLGATLFAGSPDIVSIMALAGFGGIGLIVVLFSTVTTTYLDAASAGISAQSVFSWINARVAGIAAAVIGILLALLAPVAHFEAFLYLIGSLFAPMIAILIVDYFVLHRDASKQSVDWLNICLWIAGFILYRYSMSWDFVIGNTLPVLVIVASAKLLIHVIVNRIKKAIEMRIRIAEGE